jgi:hypothetical protein
MEGDGAAEKSRCVTGLDEEGHESIGFELNDVRACPPGALEVTPDPFLRTSLGEHPQAFPSCPFVDH